MATRTSATANKGIIILLLEDFFPSGFAVGHLDAGVGTVGVLRCDLNAPEGISESSSSEYVEFIEMDGGRIGRDGDRAGRGEGGGVNIFKRR